MKSLYLLFFLVYQQVRSLLTNCKCFNVISKSVCQKSSSCLWMNGQCLTNPYFQQQDFNKCIQLDKQSCLKNAECAYMNDKCLLFTNCQVLQDCKQSNNCVLSGTKCIAQNQCKDFLTSIDCENGSQPNSFCLWNQTDQPNCQQILNCSQLPQLQLHSSCQSALSYCTVNEFGYCQNKLHHCVDYKINSCFRTIEGIECIWNTNLSKCESKSCESGIFSTDLECQMFSSDCTTNGINCIQRTDCSAVTHLNGCVYDQNNNKCFWNGTNCIKKQCSEIPFEQNCLSYFIDLQCTTTQLGYCKDFPSNCEGFETESSCNIELQNIECFWKNGICLQKTCSNVPQNYDCQSWKNDNSCMNDINGFCVEKPQYCNKIVDNTQCSQIQLQNQICQQQACSTALCSKAPKNYNSHQQCENWSIECTTNVLEGGCIKKFDFCSQYNNQEQCISTSDGSECIYRDLQCQQKLCEYGQYKSNKECQIWNKNCIYSEQQLKCVQWPMQCSSLLSQQSCNLGLQNGSFCNWTSAGCIDQLNQTQCIDATNSRDFNIHAECNKWNSNCTVIQNVGSCSPRQNCENYQNSIQCIVGIDGQQCTWDGIQCLNKCKQQSQQTLDYQVCQQLDTNCTLNDLTTICVQKSACSDYQTEQNCQYDFNNLPCKWNNTSYTCSTKVCEDFQEATTENECTYALGYQTCQLNMGGTGCKQRPLQCSEIVSQTICFNTIPKNKLNYCYYLNGNCVEINEFQCNQINNSPQSSDDCLKYNNACVFNSTLGCINKYSCDQLSSLLCKVDNSDIYTFTLDNTETITYQQCKFSQSFNIDYLRMTVSDIISCPIEGQGNFSLRQCSDLGGLYVLFIQNFQYYDGSECRDTVFQSGAPDLDLFQCGMGQQFAGLKCDCTSGGDCVKLQCNQIQNSCLLWNNECIEDNTHQCVDIQSCIDITTELECQLAYNHKLKCLWLNHQCYNFFPCDAAFASHYTEQQCIQYGLCRINKKSTGCEYKDCSEYTLMEYCQQLTNCIWDGTQCIIKQCYQAQSESECFAIVLENNQKCLWLNSSCQETYQCSDILDPLNQNDCLNFGCLINYQFSDSSNYCQTKKTTCDLYDNQFACTFDIQNNKCQWNKGTQSCKNIQCQTYTSSNGLYDNKICQQFNSDCVVNLNDTGCRQKLTDCNQYLNSNQCMQATNMQNKFCYWNGTQCIDAECNQYNLITQPPCSCFEYAQCTLLNGICSDSLLFCNSYTNEFICNLSQDLTGKFCGWINNSCEQKTCNNYPYSIFNHNNCQEWLQSCTSDSYNSKCIDIIDCTSAPLEIDSLSKCELFISPTNEICTVSATLGGCIDLPQTCNLASKNQCFSDSNKNKCYWSEQNSICKDLTCSNIDISVITALECESILNSCTISILGQGCQTKQSCSDYSINQCQMLNIKDLNNRNCIAGCQQIVCEDYLYQTDLLCQSILDGSCITNGQQCINHNTCTDFTFQNQCLISKQGVQCFWLNDQNSCVEKQCNHADLSYNNNELCSQFLSKCTYSETKQQCTDKLNCYEYINQEQCYLDKNDQICIWHQNYCYDSICLNVCGDGILDIEKEECDDGNLVQYDGCHLCQFSCVLGCLICHQGTCLECDSQLGYYLEQQNICVSKCGDQIIQGKEECDDGNSDQYDGCYNCQFQCHFACKQCIQGVCYECNDGWSISFNNNCETICGDGYLVNQQMINSNQVIEQCDDGNLENQDGCSSKCQIEDNWSCFTNSENLSICDTYNSTRMILTLLTQKSSIKQEVSVTFSNSLLLIENTKLLLTSKLLNIDNSKYNISIIPVLEPSKNQFLSIQYLISITFLINFEYPKLQVEFDNTKTVDQNNLFPMNQKQIIGLYSIYCESELEIKIFNIIKTINKIFLFILIAIAIIAILSQNPDILWNLLDMIQYLSYIKYINIEFPQNLNNYFTIFDMVTLQPVIDFLKLQDLTNLLNYGLEIQIETTNKFEQANVNAFYFYNFTSSILIFGASFFLYYFSYYCLMHIFKVQAKFQNHFLLLKFLKAIQKCIQSFISYFFYSGIIRTYLANSYDLLFTIFLQLYYPKFDSILKTISVIISGISFIFLLNSIIFIISKLTNKNINYDNKFAILLEEIVQSNNQLIKQYHSILLIKKVAFMSILIFMQKAGEIQTLFISLTHITFSLYLFQVSPIKNKFELIKNIFVETLISLSTCLYIFYSLPIFSIVQKQMIGWVHITIFTLILSFTVIIDIIQQQKLFQGWINQFNQKKEQKPIFHSVPIVRQTMFLE